MTGRSVRFRAGLRLGQKTRDVQTLCFTKDNDVCNICREKRLLTEDHVPPRSCGNNRRIIARRVYANELLAKQVDARSHNGLKFRTLCDTCNSTLIGSRDKALGEFAEQARLIVRSPLPLPDRIPVRIRAGAVLRSVLGHIVATKTRDDQVPIDDKIRSYIFAGGDLDSTIRAYCWMYPYEPTVVSRDFQFLDVVGRGGKSPGLVSILKFFPLAFCVLDLANDEDEGLQGPVTSLHSFALVDPDSEHTVELWTRPIIAPGWPERPTGDHIVLGGRMYSDSVTTVEQNGVGATPGKRIQAQRWQGGDGVYIDQLHAFAEIVDS